MRAIFAFPRPETLARVLRDVEADDGAPTWRGKVRALPPVAVEGLRPAQVVGRPDIQGFVGALHGAQASRGVFITTSRFSNEARAYTAVVPQRLVLIDGEQLASLMVDHGVGVPTEQTITLKKVDEDFFE